MSDGDDASNILLYTGNSGPPNMYMLATFSLQSVANTRIRLKGQIKIFLYHSLISQSTNIGIVHC